jgi:hypothetical protein
MKLEIEDQLIGLSQDDSIAFLRRKLIAAQNPNDLDINRPFKLKFTETNKPYEITMSALREEVVA